MHQKLAIGVLVALICAALLVPSAARSQTVPPSSPWQRGAGGVQCSPAWPFILTCSFVVYPGTVFDIDQFISTRWQQSIPVVIGAVFALLCAPFTPPVMAVCGLIGALQASYVRDQIRHAAEHYNGGLPRGECLKLSWHFLPTWPGVAAWNVNPYSGGRCQWSPPLGTCDRWDDWHPNCRVAFRA